MDFIDNASDFNMRGDFGDHHVLLVASDDGNVFQDVEIGAMASRNCGLKQWNDCLLVWRFT